MCILLGCDMKCVGLGRVMGVVLVLVVLLVMVVVNV